VRLWHITPPRALSSAFGSAYNAHRFPEIQETDAMLSSPSVVIVVSIATIRRAERRVAACERCERTVDTPFYEVLAGVTRTRSGGFAEYFLSEPAHCPGCAGPIFEDTLVELA
jgi:hypothetical protein